MARTARPGRTLDDLIRAGAIGIYNSAWEDAGGGQRGRWAGTEAVDSAFGDIAADTLRALQDRAARSRAGGRTLEEGGAGTTLGTGGHAEIPCQRRSGPDQRRSRIYQYQVDFTVTLIGKKEDTVTRDYTVLVTFNSPAAQASILAQANAQLALQISIEMQYMGPRGVQGTDVGSGTITGAFTCLV